MRHPSTIALALASTAVVSSPAFARGYHEETPEEKSDDVTIEDADAAPRTVYGIGPRLGTFHVGPIYDFAYGLSFEGGVRFDRLALLGDYMMLGLTDPGAQTKTNGTAALGDPSATEPPADHHVDGLVQRLGVLARYSAGKFTQASGGVGVRGDFWVEGGLGEQLIRWSGGGYLHRADIELGLGVGIQFRGKHHHGGYQIGFRAILSAPPDGYEANGPAQCAGPCDGPTKQVNIDRAFLGTLTVLFGD